MAEERCLPAERREGIVRQLFSPYKKKQIPRLLAAGRFVRCLFLLVCATSYAATSEVKVTGILKTKDGGFQALVDDQLVREGSVIGGIKVVEITEKGVRFSVDGKVQFVAMGESIGLIENKAKKLKVEEVVQKKDGWVVKIDGKYYRTADTNLVLRLKDSMDESSKKKM